MRRIGDEAGGFLRRHADPEALKAARVLEAWREVTGPEVSRRTHGGRFASGELLVYVESSAWANELRMMGETFKQRLNESLGEETVTSLRFSVSKRVSVRNRRKDDEAADRKRYSPRSGALRDLSADERRAVDEAAGGVADEGLREAFRRAMETSLRLRGAGREKRR